MIETNSKTNDQRHLIQCEICNAPVRQDRMERHMEKVHNISPAVPEKSIEQQPSIVRTKPSYNTVWPLTEKTGYTIVHPPKSSQQMNRTQNISNKIALLAPVKKSYLERAVRDIYPAYKKVSFGSDKKTEIIGVQKYIEHNDNVNVYLFYQGSTRYKGILINEFYFYADPKPHPNPWGSWNLTFKSYYTVAEIKEYVVPITDFTYCDKKKVEYSPRRPLWIIDVV